MDRAARHSSDDAGDGTVGSLELGRSTRLLPIRCRWCREGEAACLGDHELMVRATDVASGTQPLVTA